MDDNYNEKLLCDLATVWYGSCFSPSLGRTFKTIMGQTSNASEISKWLENEVGKVPLSIRQKAQMELEQASQLGVLVYHYFSVDYPQQFRRIEDPPLVIYVRSQQPLKWPDLSVDKTKWHIGAAVGVVGARDCTFYGMEIAKKLGVETVLAGGTVVSGLALGVDQFAHEGAIEAARRLQLTSSMVSCPTIAVIGTGVEQTYPHSNSGLARGILERGGMILSEFGLSMGARKHHFPQRNRLISALSDVIIVVEARKKSGALITARLALEQGKEVKAVPGPLNSPFSEGCNLLIKQGAEPYIGMDDIVKENPAAHFNKLSLLRSKDCKLTLEETKVVQALKLRGRMSINQIVEKTELDASLISQALAILEIESIVSVDDLGNYGLIAT